MVMLCPKCGNKLNKARKCVGCGLTIDIYNKIKNTSKLLYNQGLQKAKIRDLSSAISILKRSIKFDKSNIDAINLLGLIYFEIGEVILALQQWVTSKSIKENDNLAEYYIEQVYSNQHKLDRLNTAIKKYNQALNYIDQKNEDLAIIQFKKVISLNPKFIRAYCLLALCYIHIDNIEKAKKYLSRALSIDKNNYVALKYYESIGIVEEEKEEVVGDQKALFPSYSINKKKNIELNSSVFQLVYLIVGVAIGLAVAFFLLLPYQISKRDKEISELTKMHTNNEKIHIESINALEIKIEQIEKDLDEKEDIIENYEDKQLYYNTLEDLRNIVFYYFAGDNHVAASKLYIINTDNLINTDREILNNIENIIYPKVSIKSYNEGVKLYNELRFNEAIDELNSTIKFGVGSDISDDALYFKARSYQRMGEYDKAIELFEELLEKYPNSGKIGWTRNYLNIAKSQRDR